MDRNARNIGLTGRLDLDEVLKLMLKIIQYLDNRGLNVIVEQALSNHLTSDHSPPWQSARMSSLGQMCDLVIVVGGDGCFLGAARDLVNHGTPVLGVNRGKLGFLTDIHPDTVEHELDKVFQGQFTIEERFLLSCHIKRGNNRVGLGTALNDVVIHPAAAVQMIEFDLFIEGQFVYSQRSDGMIISTPTGSTAYALSAGGSIMHPSLDAIELVPMFPHSLSSRPLVVGGNAEIKIVLGKSKAAAQISCDGLPGYQLEEGDKIYVTKKPQKIRILHPLSHDFYNACRSKLGWSHRLI